TRLGHTQQFLREHRAYLDRLARDNVLHIFGFSDKLRPLTLYAPQNDLHGTGTNTDFRATFDQLVQRFQGRDLGGVIVISDGIDTRSFKKRGRRDQFSFEEYRQFTRLAAPIHTFGFVLDRNVKDVNVANVRYNDFAFIHNKLTIDATIEVIGVPAGSIELKLSERGRLIRKRSLRIDGKTERYQVSFDWVPRKIGTHIFALEAERLPGEVYHGNNTKRFVIKVLRDKIRVLQIAGRPTWDVRFMRSFLKENPNVDLISFFIMVNPLSVYRLSTFDTSLIPFPAQELFVEQLGSFDLVIFQDFNYGPFNTRLHLHRIRDYVLKGGAFLMIGGERAFSAGDYHGTEITDILPIEIQPRYHRVPPTDERDFRPRLTRDGRTHPITRLAFDAKENAEIWRRAPELEGLNTSLGLQSGALSLLSHPKLRFNGHRMPVAALREVKKGRTMVFMTDSSWFWKLPFAAQKGGSGTLYDRFWTNAVKWLIRDESLSLLRLTLSAAALKLSDAVTIGVRLFNPNYSPAKAQAIEIEILRWEDDAGSEKKVVQRIDGKTDDRGSWSQAMTPKEAGIYEIMVRATRNGRTETASATFLVSARNAEYDRVIADAEFLRLISKGTAGSFNDILGPLPPLWFKKPRIEQLASRETFELWNLPIVFFTLILLLAGEWLLRRRLGYP
ncbi:MAG: hypothetical protein KC609_20030, partial [Myxococcales bacterium]|nr:hypothetical protein [Myxococcales bacterium]